ncbi:MAG: carboxypeptidase-like regulatory domain-containing protein [Endomicrobiales bacterium]
MKPCTMTTMKELLLSIIFCAVSVSCVYGDSGTIAGKVTKQDGITAVPGAVLVALQNSTAVAQTVSDSAGNYSILIATGAYNVTASSTGYVTQTLPAVVTSSVTTPLNFLLVQATGTVAGKVTKQDGTTALPGASVVASQNGTPATQSVADGSGNYSLTLAPGTYSITASSTGYVAVTQPSDAVISGQITIANFALAPVPGTISGKVTKQDGTTALPGASIVASQNGTPVTQSVSDSSGNYSLTLAPGTYSITASSTGYVAVTQPSDVVISGQITTANFLLAPVPGTISGKVTKQDGITALPDALIVASQNGSAVAQSVADSSGSYSLQLVAGTYSVTASSTGYIAVTQPSDVVTSGQITTANFSLTPIVINSTGTISGKITTLGGIILSGVVVTASQNSAIISQTTSNSLGNYSLILASGTYAITASSIGYISQTQSNESVTSGQTTTVNFSLVAQTGTIPTGLGTVIANVNNSVDTTVIVTSSNGSNEVFIPAGSFSTNVVLTVSTTSVPAVLSQPAIKATAIGIDITDNPALQPLKYITITLFYSAHDISGMNVNDLVIARFDTGSSQWIPLQSMVYPGLNKITAQTNHLSLFAVVELGTSQQSATINNAYCFPSPVRFSAGEKLYFAKFSPYAAIYIISTSGSVLKKLDADPSGNVPAWDGTTDSGEHMASGVYIVHAKDENGNKKIFEIMVLK